MARLLFYCTLGKPNLYLPPEHNCFEEDEASKCYLEDEPILKGFDIKLNGKIAVACDCELVERFDVPYPAYFYEVEDKLSYITEKSCLSLMQLHHYLKIDTGYAIHLSNVKVFDEPRELSDFWQITSTYKNLFGEIVHEYQPVKKAPQNMMYVYDEDGNKYLLLSIHPKHLCNIANGEKTIEIRRRILKELKELIR